jgi:2-alkenal reductase
MESRERSVRSIKIGLASLLMVVMLALGGLAVVKGAADGGISALVTAANTSTQSITPSSAVEVKNPTATAPSTTAQQVAPAPQGSGVLDARTADKVAGPAVVTVVNNMQATTGGGRFGVPGSGQSGQALGSGVIIDSQGDIVTNQHVIANQQSLFVIFADGTQVPATLVGQDAFSDLAVIKVSAKVPGVAQFGDSDKLEPGQPVVAIGTALGDYKNTVTAGIVSALHRQLGDGGTSTQDLIQTDAAINHGNSGGPLLDLNGNVIGINTAVVRSTGTSGDIAEGLGFAIPSNTVKTVTSQLIKSGSISRPYLGITYQVITPDVATANQLPRQQGVYVTDVTTGGPAAKAGIVPNSIITKIDGTTITTDSNSTLAGILSKHKVGDSVKLTVLAPNAVSEKDITVVLGVRPSGQ